MLERAFLIEIYYIDTMQSKQKWSMVFHLLLLLMNCKNIQSEHLLFPDAFSKIFHNYDVRALGMIHRITFWK